MADIDIPKVARSVEKVDERRSARSSALREKRAKTLHCTRVVGHSLWGQRPRFSIGLLGEEDWSKLTKLQ
jgi:hypothetical protein